MRSAIFTAAGSPLFIEDRPVPDPSTGQVVIKVGRCGICGSDLKMTDPSSPFHFAQGYTPGHEYAGEVVAIGADVTQVSPGDIVTAFPVGGCGTCPACLAGDPYACAQCSYLMGGFAEYCIAQAAFVTRLPADLSLADGALVEPLACGSQAVRLGGVTPGSRILVLGAGATGLAAIFWARRAGCGAIALSAPSRRRAELAMQMGATHFVEQGDDLPARVAATLGGAPDIVFECAGTAGLITQSIDCVKPRGTVVSSGMCFDGENFVAGSATIKQVRLQFSMAYVMEDFRHALDALDAGHVEPRAMISETIGLDALPAMLEALRTDRSRCKVLVSPH